MNYPSSNPTGATNTATGDGRPDRRRRSRHVGIPLVMSFAEAGMTVNINDLNESALASLRAGKLPFIEHGAAPLLTKALANNRLVFTVVVRTGSAVAARLSSPSERRSTNFSIRFTARCSGF